jgi:hypothetical protein
MFVRIAAVPGADGRREAIVIQNLVRTRREDITGITGGYVRVRHGKMPD